MLGVRTAKEELNAMTARAQPLYPQAVCHGPAPPLLAAQQVAAGREAHGVASHDAAGGMTVPRDIPIDRDAQAR